MLLGNSITKPNRRLNVSTLFISKNSARNWLLVEVIMAVSEEHQHVLELWTSELFKWTLDERSPKTRQGRVVHACYMLNNYYRDVLHTSPPFSIYIKVFSSVPSLRESIRRRVRTVSKESELWIIDMVRSSELKGFKGKYVRVFEKVFVMRESPLSVHLAHAFTTVNSTNLSIPLIEYH